MSTVPGIGPGSFDKSTLAREQETHAHRQSHTATRFRLYTEYDENLSRLLGRYFSGATIYGADGVWHGRNEHAAVVEILGTDADTPQVFYLAEDIRRENNQSSILVTVDEVRRYDITAD